MRNLPVLLKARYAHTWQENCTEKNGQWIPARTLPYYPNPVRALQQRLRLAAGVFSGRYDAVYWGGR